MSNKIAVELQLKLQGLAAQAKQAARIVKENIGTAGAGAGINAGIDKATKSQDNLTKSVKATTAALKEQAAAAKLAALAEAQATVDRLRAAREAAGRRMGIPAWMGPEQAQKFTDPVEAAERKRMANQLRAQRNASRNTGGGLATNPAAMFGYQGPPPPIIAPPVIAPGAGAPTPPGGVAGLANKLLPLGQILATMYMVRRAFNAVIAPVQQFTNVLRKATEQAAALYAGATMSGLGLGPSAMRSSLARVLGVSEKDIFLFGREIEHLIPKLRGAREIMEQTAPNLASVNWEWNVLRENLKATVALLADKMSGAIKTFLAGLSEMLVRLQNVTQQFSETLRDNPDLAKTFSRVGKMTAAMAGGPGAWMAVEQILKAGKGKEMPNMGAPMAFMRQMPAANWEHMGLQVGGTGAMQFMATTAKSTTDTAKGVQALLAAMRENKFNITKPVGYPSRS